MKMQNSHMNSPEWRAFLSAVPSGPAYAATRLLDRLETRTA